MLTRQRDPEMMDDPSVPSCEHRRALAGLARINALSRASASVWEGVERVLGPSFSVQSAGIGASISLLDVATGSGDVALGVARCARAMGYRTLVHVCDISSEALDAAAERAARVRVPVALHRFDVRVHALPFADHEVDVAMCSLFLHHLDAVDAIRCLREMARVARRGVVVNDLVRSQRGLLAARIAGRVVTRSQIVRIDAVRSVRAAWTPQELGELAEAAGLHGACVARVFPWRMTLHWRRP
jgi:ubiquinone/menaquinone biosynthesis C-methylase UbiE